MAPPLPSLSTAAVLAALARGHRFGLAIMRETGLPSGTVYPILARAEAAGLLRSAWESPEDRTGDVGRPPRRYYELTKSGAAALDAAQSRMAALAGAMLPRGSE
jgi:DNA-binding PadR family transcriptional regulator